MSAPGKRLADLSRSGDILHRPDQMMDRDLFIPPIETASAKPADAPGGRPAWHPKVLFKLGVVQRLHDFPDEQKLFELADRPGFQRFAGPTLADAMAGRNTLWGIRKKLRRSGVLDRLFALFDEALRSCGLLPKDRHIVAPRSSRFPSSGAAGRRKRSSWRAGMASGRRSAAAISHHTKWISDLYHGV